MKGVVLIMILLCYLGLAYGFDSGIVNCWDKGPVLKRLDRRELELAQINPSGDGGSGSIFSGGNMKSVPRALLYSLIVPGAGEIYCKSYIKAAFMLGLEITFWALYFVYDKKGDEKTKEFEAFADEHWIKELFTAWLSIADTTSVPPVEHLPPTKDQQYYEMIGKYNWFLPGWDDFNGNRQDPDPRHLSQQYCDSLGIGSANREIYLNMRADANRFYKTAKYFVGASILNHVVSALDAAFTAKRNNNRVQKGFSEIHLRSGLVMKSYVPEYRLTLEVTFR